MGRPADCFRRRAPRVACGKRLRSSIRSNRPAEEVRNDGAGSAPMARRVAGPDPGIPPDGNGRSRREADRAPPGEPALFPVRGEAHVPDHLGRALRRRPEPRLRLRALSGRAAPPRVQPHADVHRDVSRDPRLVQDRGQYPGAGPRAVCRPLGPVGDARGGRRREQVRPRELGRGVLPAAEDVLRRGRGARDRRRARPVLPLLRRGALGGEPDARPEQRQRCRVDAAQRGLHAEAPRDGRAARGVRAQGRRRAQGVRQPLLRDLQRAVRAAGRRPTGRRGSPARSPRPSAACPPGT